jgi:hypothetical protein
MKYIIYMSPKPLQCIACGQYLENVRHFRCKKCRKGPMCMSHLDVESDICSACSMEIRAKRLKNLSGTQKSANGIFRLMEFIFILCAVFFAATRLMPEHMPEFLKDNIFSRNLYIWAGISAFGSVVFCASSRILKGKVVSLEEEIKTKIRGY